MLTNMRFKRYGLSVCLICLLMSTASIRAALVPNSSWDAFVSQFLEQYFVYQPTTLIASLWPTCPQVRGYAPCPHVTVPTCPLEGSAFAGRDGCPQPSVRRENCALRERFYSRSAQPSSPIFYPRSGQRRVGDNPPYLKTSRRQSTPYLDCLPLALVSPRRLRLRW